MKLSAGNCIKGLGSTNSNQETYLLSGFGKKLVRHLQKGIFLWLALCLLLAAGEPNVSAQEAQSGEWSVSPSRNNGQPWRVGYLEGGPYFEYQMMLRAVILSLAELGWVNGPFSLSEASMSALRNEPLRPEIKQGLQSLKGKTWPDRSRFLNAVSEAIGAKAMLQHQDVILSHADKLEIPPMDDREDTSQLWNWAAENLKNPYLEFAADAHYSPNWDDTERVETRQALLKRLNQSKDLDLMIAMGTWAGQDLANDEHQTPVLVFASSDPVASNIVKSIEDSGRPHLHARVDPDRFERQINIFYEVFHFNKLGIAYENTPEGESYAGLSSVKKVAERRLFDVVTCFTRDETAESLQEAEQSINQCAQELAPKVDAFYVTAQRGVNADNLPKVLRPFHQAGVPTFSQFGSEEVKFGVLMSLAQSEFKYSGGFHARNIARVLNGAQPGALPQVFKDPPKLAMNLATAEAIHYRPRFQILLVTDEFFDAGE